MLNTTFLAILIVIVTVIFVKYLENQNSSWLKILLQWVPPILFAYILPALMSFIININFQNVVIHRWSKEIIIPVAIITVMSSMSLKQLRIIGIKPIILFVLGSFTIAILPVILIGMITQFFPNQAAGFMAGDMWKGLIPLVGSWIGGSTSQLVLKEYVGTAENLFLSIIILDNILVNIWTILMFQLIRQSGRLDRVLNIEASPEIASELKYQSKVKKNGFFTVLIVVLILLLTTFLSLPFLGVIVVLSFLGILLGNSFRFWHHQWCLNLGSFAIITVMAILGLKLNFGSFSLPFSFILIVLVWLLLQFICSLILAYILRLSMVWVPIASMANFGGISTAPAVTAAYNPKLMPHAIVLAILSMLTGTFWGIFSTWLLRLSIGI